MPQTNIYGKCTWSRLFSLYCFLKTLIIDIDLKQNFQLLLSNRRRSGCGRCWVPSLTDTGWISCWSHSVAPTSGSSTWLRASPTPGAPVFLPSKNHEAKCREYLKFNADLYFKCKTFNMKKLYVHEMIFRSCRSFNTQIWFLIDNKVELRTIWGLPNLIHLSDPNHVQMESLMWPHGSLAEGTTKRLR